jgi:hypothetical protein
MRPPERRQTYAALSSALISAGTSLGRSGEHLATGRAGACRARLVEPVLAAKQPGQPGRMGCYRACWIDEDPVLQYAPFSPHYAGFTPPRTSITGDREPPPLLGSRLSAELAAMSAVVRTKSRSVNDPVAAQFPVFVGYCGVHSAGFGPVLTGDLGRSGAAAPTALAPRRPDL